MTTMTMLGMHGRDWRPLVFVKHNEQHILHTRYVVQWCAWSRLIVLSYLKGPGCEDANCKSYAVDLKNLNNLKVTACSTEKLQVRGVDQTLYPTLWPSFVELGSLWSVTDCPVPLHYGQQCSSYNKLIQTMERPFVITLYTHTHMHIPIARQPEDVEDDLSRWFNFLIHQRWQTLLFWCICFNPKIVLASGWRARRLHGTTRGDGEFDCLGVVPPCVRPPLLHTVVISGAEAAT